jgi:hypothetical protein
MTRLTELIDARREELFPLESNDLRVVRGCDGQPTIAMKQEWRYSALRKSVYDKLPGHWQPCGSL